MRYSLQFRGHMVFLSCKGPALYAYNNAPFTDEDWERIQMAGRSAKVNDPNKIGRFGIGFNSVYHITGKPYVVCSSRMVKSKSYIHMYV